MAAFHSDLHRGCVQGLFRVVDSPDVLIRKVLFHMLLILVAVDGMAHALEVSFGLKLASGSLFYVV